MTNESIAYLCDVKNRSQAVLYAAGLDGSTSPLDVDCWVPIDQAAGELLKRFRGMPGNRLPLKTRRFITPAVANAVCEMQTGELDGLEVLSTYHGCLSLRGITLPAGVAGVLRFITVGHSGFVRINDSCPSGCVAARIKQALQNVSEGSAHG